MLVPQRPKTHHALGLELRRLTRKAVFLTVPTAQVIRLALVTELVSPCGKSLLHLGGMERWCDSLSFGVLGFWTSTFK